MEIVYNSAKFYWLLFITTSPNSSYSEKSKHFSGNQVFINDEISYDFANEENLGTVRPDKFAKINP